MLKRYVLVVRDRIITSRPCTDEVLKNLECYYKSPIFLSDGTKESFESAIDYFYECFSHFCDWNAELIAVE